MKYNDEYGDVDRNFDSPRQKEEARKLSKYEEEIISLMEENALL